MEITVPEDDRMPSLEPCARYNAALSDGSVVWEAPNATDCILIGSAYHELYGFAVFVDEGMADHGAA